MKNITLSLAIALLATTAGAANAAGSLDLSRYSVSKATSLRMGEASGVTYNWDRNSLMVIGDEATGDEFNLDGSHRADVSDYLGFSTYHDTEGLTHMGNKTYMVADERLMTLGTTVVSDYTIDNGDGTKRYFVDAVDRYSLTGYSVGNIGLEGVSYDPITGGFFAVKEADPQGVYFVSNATGAAGAYVDAFDPAKLGLITLSDIQVLSTGFAGTDFEGNLLILSATSQMLLEVTRTGDVVSSFDLSNIIADNGFRVNAIEGVTIDFDGNIYLVAENGGGTGSGSALVVLSAPALPGAVPEPATWAMMVGGLGFVGASMRRRRATVRFA